MLFDHLYISLSDPSMAFFLSSSNSLTFLELIPSEFKKLPIPYFEIEQNQFENFTTDFENKSNIEQILNQNDFNILNSTMGIDYDNLKKLTEIRNKLKKKRLREYANA